MNIFLTKISFSVLFIFLIAIILFSSLYHLSNKNSVYNNTHYTIELEGSDYVARNQEGIIVASNSNFVTMMNSLNSIVTSGQTVMIQNGVYPINGKIDWKVSGSTIVGQSTGAILRSSSSYTSSEMMILGNSTNHITINGLTFDNNFADNPWAPLLVSGSYNTVENCRFLNIMQYGLLAFAADHFQFLNNYVNKAQYGIATGGGLGYPFCTNGLIQGNTIRDTRDAGIKLRWCSNVTVQGNDIDVEWLTWMNQPKSDQSPSGITFYQADGPDINVVVNVNNIHNSGAAQWVSSGIKYTVNGVLVQADDPSNWGGYSGSSSGQVISGNVISGMYYGIQSYVTSVRISDNIISSSAGSNIQIS